MKRFLIKFLAFYSLFFAVLGYYHFAVLPDLSGDLGEIGQIRFGKEYDGLDIEGYDRPDMSDANVVKVTCEDSVHLFRILTLGDSFSQYYDKGWQYGLSGQLKMDIGHIHFTDNGNLTGNPFQDFVSIANSGCIEEGQTIIVESVERSLISRLLHIDFSKTYDPQYVVKDTQSEGETYLNRFLSWIRLSAGYKNPVLKYDLSVPCFSHPKFSSTLFSFFEDMSGMRYSSKEYDSAMDKLLYLNDFAKEKGIRLFVLLAADKYDAYEPWITADHVVCGTLDNIPESHFIFNSKPCLREAIGNGLLDVYPVNNTHWSVRGADIVSFSMVNALKELTIDNASLDNTTR